MGRILPVARHGTKRQRAKYRNAWCTLSEDGKTLLGTAIIKDFNNEKMLLKLAREGRRMGHPDIADGDRVRCPSWHGVKGLRGPWVRFC